MWPDSRIQQLTQSATAIFARASVRFTLIPSSGYHFCDDYVADFSVGLDPVFQYIPPKENLTDVDIILLTAHGSDVSHVIWHIRRKLAGDKLVGVWLWDNHLQHEPNLQTAYASDFLFPSHKYVSDYLITPTSIPGGHVPHCCTQWQRGQAVECFEQFRELPRSDRLLVNYVDYPFSPRTQLLRALKSQMPEANVLLMAPNERSRYYGKTRAERFKEWMEYKSTLILPVDRDLSQRVFDALLCGQILVVPNIIPDFDEVIPPAIQTELGIIRLQSLQIGAIRQAATQAARVFDEMGSRIVEARHRYVLHNHMMVNRIRTMLDSIKAVGTGQTSVIFDGNSTLRDGLHLKGPA